MALLYFFQTSPSESRNPVYNFIVPHMIRPREYLLQAVLKENDEHEPLITLLLINKQVHGEISYVLYQHSHFVISINSVRVTSVALKSSIWWELGQTQFMSVKLASNIRHIDVDIVLVEEWRFASAIAMNLRLSTLLNDVCEHLRDLRRLKTLTVRWKFDGNLNL